MTVAEPWAGAWVQHHLGVRLTTTSSPVGLTLPDLVGMALRRNPKRAHLLVSSVLGKHVPVAPSVARAFGCLLGRLVATHVDPNAGFRSLEKSVVAAACAGNTEAAAALIEATRPTSTAGTEHAVVIGFAETATALGHLVAEALSCDVLHSTRHAKTGLSPYEEFTEAHSHAVDHLLVPEDHERFEAATPVVLVDDELSTGRTAENVIRALHKRAPRSHYVVAALIDLRSEADHYQLLDLASELNTQIDVVCLVNGRIELPDRVLEIGAELVEQYGVESSSPSADAPITVPVHCLDAGDTPVSARHLLTHSQSITLETLLNDWAEQVIGYAGVADGESVLVLGTEEFMYVPLRLAEAMAAADGIDVFYASTTRSPVAAIDEAGYAVRSAASFEAIDGDSDAMRYSYNLKNQRFDHVVVISEAGDEHLARNGGDMFESIRRAAGGKVSLISVASSPRATS